MDALTIGLLTAGVAGGLALILRSKRTTSSELDFLAHRVMDDETEAASEDRKDQHTQLIERPNQQYRLLNNAEQELYFRLLEAMPNMRIFSQVGVAQLAQLRGRMDAHRLNPMSSRGVDFVICDSDFSIVAAIELSWPNPDGEISPEREKTLALESLGVPLIFFRPNSLPDSEIICREIADAIVRRNRLEKERVI